MTALRYDDLPDFLLLIAQRLPHDGTHPDA
jgi:hypothetical protein